MAWRFSYLDLVIESQIKDLSIGQLFITLNCEIGIIEPTEPFSPQNYNNRRSLQLKQNRTMLVIEKQKIINNHLTKNYKYMTYTKCFVVNESIFAYFPDESYIEYFSLI